MSWIQIGLMIASALAANQAQRGVTKKQNALMDQKTAYQTAQAKKSEEAINKYISPYEEPNRQNERTSIEQSVLNNYQDTGRAASAYAPPTASAGKVNPDFERRAGVNAASTAERVRQIFADLSKMRTPGQQDLSNSYRLAMAMGDVDAANRAAGNVGAKYDIAAQNVTPDPWLSLISQVAGGASMATGNTGPQVFGGGTATGVTPLAPAGAGIGGVGGGGLGYKPVTSMFK